MTVEDKLARARDTYRCKLLERLEVLGELIGRQRRDADLETLREAQRLAHRICGSAGTFGFTEASEALAIVDQTLLSLLAGDLEPSQDLWDRLEDALRRAQNGCDDRRR
jgi:chemotaxis protein histidine kinase CheA